MSASVAVSIYVDHQEVIDFPIRILTQRFGWVDEVWLHGGDEVSTALLARDNQHHGALVRNIHHKIVTPDDIAKGRNKCWDEINRESSCDWLVFIAADTIPTQMAGEKTLELIDKNLYEAVSIPTHLSFLYLDIGTSPYGFTIVRRDSELRFSGDGFLTTEFIGDPLCLHLGYFSSEEAVRHQLQHFKTWSDRSGRVPENTDEYLRFLIGEIRNRRTVCGAGPNHTITRLSLVDEQEFSAKSEFLHLQYVGVIRELGLAVDVERVRGICDSVGRGFFV